MSEAGKANRPYDPMRLHWAIEELRDFGEVRTDSAFINMGRSVVEAAKTVTGAYLEGRLQIVDPVREEGIREALLSLKGVLESPAVGRLSGMDPPWRDSLAALSELLLPLEASQQEPGT